MAPRHKQLASAARRGYLIPLGVIARAQQCAAYGRVSSDKQREEQTIDTQKNLLIADITARDRDDLPESEQRKLVAQFWDDGVTGTIPLEQRSEGRRLVNLICRRGNTRCEGDCEPNTVVDTLWITKLDRLARKLQILIEIEAFLRRHGVALRCLEFNIDTSDRNGKLMFHILGVIAEWERETILERTSGGRRTKAAEGKTVGGRPTFGLKTDEDGYFVVDTTLIESVQMAACDVVRAIFENVAFNGSTAWQEAERFGMTQRKVLNILHNRRYKGESGMLDKGTWLAGRNAPPQLVSPEVWDLAQTSLTQNRAMSSRNRHYEYLLSQLLVCCEPFSHIPVYHEDGSRMGRNPKTPGICGRNLCGRIEKRNHSKSYVYYTCTRANGDRTVNDENGCGSRPIRGREIEDAVWQLVAKAQRYPQEFLDETLGDIDRERMTHDLRMEMTGIIDHLSRLESERYVILRQEQKNQISEAEADTRLTEVMSETKALQDHKRAVELQIHSLSLSATELERAGIVAADVIEQIDRIEAQCASTDAAEVSLGRQRKAALIHSTVERIEVRTISTGGHRLLLFLRFGQSLALDLPSGRSPQTGDLNSVLPDEERFLKLGGDYTQQRLLIRELVLAPSRMGRPKGWKATVS